MATGAPPLPPLHPVCPGGLSRRGGRGGGPGCLGHSFRGKQRRCWRSKSQGDRQPDKGKRSSPRNHFRFDFLAHFRPFFSRRRLQRLFFSSCVKSSGQIADREVPKQSGYTLDRHAELTDRIMFLTYFCLRRKSMCDRVRIAKLTLSDTGRAIFEILPASSICPGSEAAVPASLAWNRSRRLPARRAYEQNQARSADFLRC
jgi:hypothetical protein